VRERAAIGAIRTIHTVEVMYRSQYRKYATSLPQLGPPTRGPSSAAAADLMEITLARGEKGGYRFNLKPDGDGYVITAEPVTFGVTGLRSFYSDQNMVIRQNFGPEPATANSREMK